MAAHPSTTSDATVDGQIIPAIAKLDTPGDNAPGTLVDWPRRGLILVAVAVIGVLQFFTPSTAVHWIYVLQRLYYIPIVLAGLSMGLRGGLAAAFLSGIAFMVGTPSIWTVSRVDVLDQCLETCVFCLVGGVAGILTDRRRKQDQALRKTTEELRRAHQELHENFEGMKRAERLYALGQLSAGLAHEIRNPLASIEGAAAVVQRERESEDRRREFLDIIQKECRRLNQLLTSFLSFARPSPPDLKTVEIDGLLDSVIVLAQHAGETRRWDLKKQIQPGLSRLVCDPEQLKQVLLNLVMNAIQATPQGGTVVLAAREDGNKVTIDVHDQGCGISADSLDRVFDPFFTTKETGTGLGLSLAHQIVSQHGGTLTVARNSPDGVTMRVSLPRPASRT
jgi:signal transduction histidine kinase